MKTKIMFITCLLVLALASGCGTLASVFNHPDPPFGVYSGTKAAAHGHVTQWDVPFSLVADTILLPISVPFDMYHKTNSSKENMPEK